MNVADLYVNLGLKGKAEVSKGLGDVGGELSGVQTMSLEAKAAILGVVYGFEQMMSKAMQLGTSLSSFSTITGISSKDLQQYRYVMEGTGQSADELQGFLGSIQKQMTNMDFSKGTPEGFQMLQRYVGAISDLDRHSPIAMLQKLQEFSQVKGLPDTIKNHVLDSFQMPDGVKFATRIGAFTQKALANAPTVSDNTLNANRMAMGKWSQLWTKLENQLMNFNGKHGQMLITNISAIADSMFRLADSLLKIADRFKIFEWAQKALEGWKLIIDEINAAASSQNMGDDIKGITNQNWKTTLWKTMFNSDAEKRAQAGLKRLGEQDTAKYSLRAPMQNPSKPVVNQTNNYTTYAHGVEGAEGLNDLIREKKQITHNSTQSGVAN